MYTQGLDHTALGLLHTLDGLGVDGDVARLGACEAHLIIMMRVNISTMPKCILSKAKVFRLF